VKFFRVFKLVKSDYVELVIGEGGAELRVWDRGGSRCASAWLHYDVLLELCAAVLPAAIHGLERRKRLLEEDRERGLLEEEGEEKLEEVARKLERVRAALKLLEEAEGE